MSDDFRDLHGAAPWRRRPPRRSAREREPQPEAQRRARPVRRCTRARRRAPIAAEQVSRDTAKPPARAATMRSRPCVDSSRTSVIVVSLSKGHGQNWDLPRSRTSRIVLHDDVWRERRAHVVTQRRECSPFWSRGRISCGGASARTELYFRVPQRRPHDLDARLQADERHALADRFVLEVGTCARMPR
jgi:hypothetical protein